MTDSDKERKIANILESARKGGEIFRRGGWGRGGTSGAAPNHYDGELIDEMVRSGQLTFGTSFNEFVLKTNKKAREGPTGRSDS